MIILLLMSARAIEKNLTRKRNNNPLHVENNNKRPSILRVRGPRKRNCQKV